MGSYIFLSVIILRKFGFWDISLLKDTILWSLLSGFALIIRFVSANRQNSLSFKAAILDNLKIIAVIEFTANLSSFSLITEIILLPLAIFISASVALSETSEDYINVKKIFIFLQGLLGAFYIGSSIVIVFTDPEQALTMHTLKAFLLPVILTTFFIPFIYAVALYSRYETVFWRLNIWNKDEDLKKLAKKIIFKKCHFRLDKVDTLSTSEGLKVLRANSSEEMNAQLRLLFDS